MPSIMNPLTLASDCQGWSWRAHNCCSQREMHNIWATLVVEPLWNITCNAMAWTRMGFVTSYRFLEHFNKNWLLHSARALCLCSQISYATRKPVSMQLTPPGLDALGFFLGKHIIFEKEPPRYFCLHSFAHNHLYYSHSVCLCKNYIYSIKWCIFRSMPGW